MLDTNIVSHFMRFPSGLVAQRIREYGDAGLCVSIVVVSELRYGVRKAGSLRLAQQVDFALATIDILAFNEPADREFAQLRVELSDVARRSVRSTC